MIIFLSVFSPQIKMAEGFMQLFLLLMESKELECFGLLHRLH